MRHSTGKIIFCAWVAVALSSALAHSQTAEDWCRTNNSNSVDITHCIDALRSTGARPQAREDKAAPPVSQPADNEGSGLLVLLVNGLIILVFILGKWLGARRTDDQLIGARRTLDDKLE